MTLILSNGSKLNVCYIQHTFTHTNEFQYSCCIYKPLCKAEAFKVGFQFSKLDRKYAKNARQLNQHHSHLL